MREVLLTAVRGRVHWHKSGQIGVSNWVFVDATAFRCDLKRGFQFKNCYFIYVPFMRTLPVVSRIRVVLFERQVGRTEVMPPYFFGSWKPPSESRRPSLIEWNEYTFTNVLPAHRCMASGGWPFTWFRVTNY